MLTKLKSPIKGSKGGIDMFGVTPVKNSTPVKGNTYGDFYDAIDNFFNDDLWNRSYTGKGVFKMDVKEDEAAYIIEAELPGVKKEEVSLEFNKDTLYIAVDHKLEETSEKVKYLHRERRSTKVQRGIYLEDINKEAIEAKMDNGILTVTVPKLAEAAKKLSIEIQ